MFNGPVFNNEVVQANSRAVNNAGFSESLDEANSLYSRLTGASFELVPSSYKGGVVYSGVPNTGNGDLTWTRGSDAWRTNSNGLVQRAPWNLFVQSQTFTSASWLSGGSGTGIYTDNFATAPDGTMTASRWTAAGSGYQTRQNVGTINSTGTLSVWMRSNSGTKTATLFINDGISAFSVISVTTTWQRFVLTGNIGGTLSGSGRCGWYSNSVLTTSDYIEVWGAQYVEGSNALPYFPTTDRLNVPRLSYEYGSSPALLLEPQRTNLAQNSGFVGTGSAPTNWTQPGGTGTSSLTASNLGVGVQACSQSATAQRPFLQQDLAVSANTTYTFSMYVESISGTIKYENIMFITNPPVGATTSYFLDGVAVNEVTQATTGRLSIRLVVGALTGTISLRCGLGVSSTVTGSMLFSRPQLEVGAYSTTFILTGVGLTATRLADQFTRNNIYTNGLITAAGGTWFVELRNNVAYVGDANGEAVMLAKTDSISENGIRLNSAILNSRTIIYKRLGGSTTMIYVTTTTNCKLAFKWNGVGLDIFENGVKVVSNTSFTELQMQFLFTNINSVPRYIQQMALFPTPLSDDQCVALTSDFTEGESVIGSYERYVNSNGGAVENLNTITNLIQNLK